MWLYTPCLWVLSFPVVFSPDMEFKVCLESRNIFCGKGFFFLYVIIILPLSGVSFMWHFCHKCILWIAALWHQVLDSAFQRLCPFLLVPGARESEWPSWTGLVPVVICCSCATGTKCSCFDWDHVLTKPKNDDRLILPRETWSLIQVLRFMLRAGCVVSILAIEHLKPLCCAPSWCSQFLPSSSVF